MGAVHVGIGHHDDLVVAGLLDVETGAGSRTDHLDDRGALLVVEHLAQRCLLHVEYLASDRQQRLESGIARSLGRAERGVALDDEQLGHIVVARLAVGQFRRHGGGFERVLAARDLLGLARLDAGVHLADNLLQHTTGLLLVAAFGARDHLAELLVGHPGDDGLDGSGAEHVLGLPLELRLGDAHGDDGHESGQDVVALDAHVRVLEVHLEFAGVVFNGLADLLGEPHEETVDVHAATGRLDHVDEAAHRRVVPVGPPHRDVDAAFAGDFLGVQFAALADRLGLLLVGVLAGDAPDVGYRLSRGQEIDEVLDTAGVAEFLDAGVRVAGRVHLRRLDRGGDCGRSRFGFTCFNGIFDGRVGRRGDVGSVHQAGSIVGGRLCGVDFHHLVDAVVAGFRHVLVDDGDPQSRHQETGLAHTVDELLVAEFGGVVEDFGIGPVSDARARGLRADLADDLQLGRAVLAGALERRVRGRMLGIGVGIYAWMTLVEGHVMGFAVAVDLDVQTRAQRVDDGRADAVQAAGRVIGRVAELRAGMQLGQHDLDAGELGLRLDVDGDATAVVGHFHGAVVVQGHRDMVAGARKRLVHRVVDDLPQAVHQTLAVGGADVHAGALAHRVQAFEHGKAVGTVFLFGHTNPIFCITRGSPHRGELSTDGSVGGGQSTEPPLLA